MCDTTVIGADGPGWGWGVIQSKKYPNYESNVDCTLTISTNDPNKSIRFYVTDIQIQYSQISNSESCDPDFLRVSDGTSRETYCGGRSVLTTYSYTTCSNTLTINYKTGSASSIRSRGFNGYYECS